MILFFVCFLAVWILLCLPQQCVHDQSLQLNQQPPNKRFAKANGIESVDQIRYTPFFVSVRLLLKLLNVNVLSPDNQKYISEDNTTIIHSVQSIMYLLYTLSISNIFKCTKKKKKKTGTNQDKGIYVNNTTDLRAVSAEKRQFVEILQKSSSA